MHIPVLLKEIEAGLDLKEGDIFLDGTINSGGHSVSFCQMIGETGTIVGIDQDSGALAKAEKRLASCPGAVHLTQSNFRNLDKVLEDLGISHIDKALFDLGLSSDQLAATGRGFSFQSDEPLLMTFNPHPGVNDLTAREIVNTWAEDNIADIIYGYGDEQFSRRIAKAIVEARRKEPIKTTFQLVEIIEKSVPFFYRKRKVHCATKTFQALRTTVNDEIESAKEGIAKAFSYLSIGGRIAVISFHSIEDRAVKIFFKEKKTEGRGRLITRRIITPSSEELKENPRARSAKLRIIEKIA